MKLTVNKTVFWDAGQKKMSGKIKQIIGDVAVVKCVDANYIVNKSLLTTKPFSKLASLYVIAGIKDKHPDRVEFEINFDGSDSKMTWLDLYDEKGQMKGCATDANDPVIQAVDSAWVSGTSSSKKAWNTGGPPKTPPDAKPQTVEEPSVGLKNKTPQAPQKAKQTVQVPPRAS